VNILDALANVAAFVWEALLSYAATEEGKRHLAQVIADIEGATANVSGEAVPMDTAISSRLAQVMKAATSKATPETEAQRRARLGK
jgi:hypothetical protein